MVSANGLTAVDVLQIVDIRTKIVSVSSFAIGTAYAVAHRHAFAPAAFALMLGATLCVDMGTTAFNSYYDFLHGVDTRDTDVERWKALVQRGVAPGVARAIAWTMFALAAVLGIALGALVDWKVVGVGAACMAVGLLYSAGPLAIARLPVGEAFAGGLLGLVLIAVSAYMQGLPPTPDIAWLGLPSSMLIATILSVNNACDRMGDARAGRRTLGIILGPEGAARAIVLQAVVTLALVAGPDPGGRAAARGGRAARRRRRVRRAHARADASARLFGCEQGGRHGRYLRRIRRVHTRDPCRHRDERVGLAVTGWHMTRFGLATALACVAAGSPLAYYEVSLEYEETPAVAARFPDPPSPLTTPGFKAKRVDFTSQPEIAKFLDELAKRTSDMRVLVAGRSIEDRPIPLVVLARPPAASGAALAANGKPTVLVIAQQHGNEPAGGEAALVLAQQLAGERRDCPRQDQRPDRAAGESRRRVPLAPRARQRRRRQPRPPAAVLARGPHARTHLRRI